MSNFKFSSNVDNCPYCEEMQKYVIPALKNLFNEESEKVIRQLDKTLGTTALTDVLSHKSHLSDNMKKLLGGLSGPHAETLLKVRKIQQAVEP